MPSATDSTVPTSVRSALEVSRPSIRLLRIEVISSGLICIGLAPWQARRRYACATCFRSCSSRLRIEASRIDVADPQHDPAEDVGIDARSRARRALGLLADPLARCSRRSTSSSSTALVTSTGSSSRLILPQLLVARSGSGRSPASGGARSAPRGSSSNAGSAPVTARCRPSFFSSVEKYGEKKNTARSRLSCSASANCAELLADLVERRRAPWRPRTAPARRPGRSLPLVAGSAARS